MITTPLHTLAQTLGETFLGDSFAHNPDETRDMAAIRILFAVRGQLIHNLFPSGTRDELVAACWKLGWRREKHVRPLTDVFSRPETYSPHCLVLCYMFFAGLSGVSLAVAWDWLAKTRVFGQAAPVNACGGAPPGAAQDTMPTPADTRSGST